METPTIQGAGGNDFLYVTSGTAYGGPGDDRLQAIYSLTQARADGQADLCGGAGNDLLSFDVEGDPAHRADGGAGDDIVAIENVARNGIDVTLGEGSDALRAYQDNSPRNGLNDDLRIADFDTDADRVEFVTSDFPSFNEITGVDVTAEQVAGEDAARVNFSVNYQFEGAGVVQTGTDLHEAIFEGLDPADAGDIMVDILPAEIPEPETKTLVTPFQSGTELVYNITENDFLLPNDTPATGAAPTLADTSAQPGGADNPLAAIERVVLNIGPDVEGDIYADFTSQYFSVDLAGTDTQTGFLLNIVRGPEGLTGPGLTQDEISDDDSLYLTRGEQDESLAEERQYLAPFERVGLIFLGAISTGDAADENYNTVNEVEVVINRA